jgi:hypothetical protein
LSERVILSIQRQAAAVGMFLRFFRFGILAFEIGERYVQRLVTEADSQAFTVEHLTLTRFEAVAISLELSQRCRLFPRDP